MFYTSLIETELRLVVEVAGGSNSAYRVLSILIGQNYRSQFDSLKGAQLLKEGADPEQAVATLSLELMAQPDEGALLDTVLFTIGNYLYCRKLERQSYKEVAAVEQISDSLWKYDSDPFFRSRVEAVIVELDSALMLPEIQKKALNVFLCESLLSMSGVDDAAVTEVVVGLFSQMATAHQSVNSLSSSEDEGVLVRSWLLQRGGERSESAQIAALLVPLNAKLPEAALQEIEEDAWFLSGMKGTALFTARLATEINRRVVLGLELTRFCLEE